MSLRLAYVMGARNNADTVAEMKRGAYPRAEFQVFLERNQATLLDYNTLEASSLPLARFFLRRGQWNWGAAACALAATPRFDAFLTTGEDIGLPLALLAGARGVRSPIHIITHGSYFGSNKFRSLMKLVRRMKNVHFLCLADSLRVRLIEDFGVPSARALNAGYAADTHFFEPPSAAPQNDLIASAGSANRDYRTLVQAASALNARVKIAAGSAWFNNISVDISGESLPAHIECRSRNYLELRDLYASALFVVVPLHPGKHACGYAVIADAMAMGKAVIATRTDSVSDFLVDGETGFYVRPGDSEDLQVRMRFFLDNPEEALRMGSLGRERMAREFSVESYCLRLEQALGMPGASTEAIPNAATDSFVR